MDKFTPEQLLAVAREVMPVEEGFEHTQYEWHFLGNRLVHRESMSLVEFDPETNDTQWRALAEWCSTYPHRFTLYVAQGEITEANAIGPEGSALCGTGNNLSGAMIAAVLAYLVNNNG